MLYDFTDFIDRHPGGESWLRLTKGTDITEAFETHHITDKAEKYLSKFKIREAKNPRNIKLTFNEDGFYRTLKNRVRDKLKDVDVKKLEFRSRLIIDFLLLSVITTLILTAKTKSLVFASLCGLFLCWTTIAAHNFFHKKDNWRMKLFNMSFCSYREWRLSHSMSHHLYTNSLLDLEITWFEPFLVWLPDPKKKGFLQRFGSWIYGPFMYAMIFKIEFFKRIFHGLYKGSKTIFVDDLIPFSLPAIMIAVNPNEIFAMLFLWVFIVTAGSFLFGLIGLNAAHHHPDIVHPGDGFQ
jgi:hypothetical protein